MLAADNTARLCSRCHREQRDQLRAPPEQLRDEFFETDEFRAAFESQHIGKIFKAYRNHGRHLLLLGKALNQELLGQWLGLTQAQVSKIENGKPEQNLEVLRNYAKILHLPQRFLWFDLPGQSRLSVSRDISLTPHIQRFPELVAEVANESTRFLDWADTSNVGDLTIEQLHGEVRRVARNYLQAPTIPLFERTTALRNRAIELLRGHQKMSHTRDLYSVAGWSLTVLAWMSTDLGFPSSTEEHLRAAWLCAENADQDNLRAWVRATQHTAARWESDFSSAAEYAEDGLRYVSGGSTELFLSSALALDRARLGDRDGGYEALTRAKRAAETLDSTTDELAGPFTCPVGRAGGFWSDVHLALDSPAEALTLADEAVSTFESTPSDLRNPGSERMVRCRQVQALIQLGEMEGAWDAFLPILSTAPEHRVQPLVQIVETIASAAKRSRYGEGPIALDMVDTAISFRGNKTLRALPPFLTCRVTERGMQVGRDAGGNARSLVVATRLARWTVFLYMALYV